jgi:uncharacterized RmlC-like cupin family protein
MTQTKYDKYIIQGVVAENKWGGQGISLSKVPDGIVPAESKMTLGVTAVRKAYMFHEPVHKHTFTEYFYFFGSGPCMNDFEAEVEYSFGEQSEKQTINTSSIVIIPPMVYHCPLNFAKIPQPIYCLEAFLATKRTEINLKDEKDQVEIRIPENNYKKYFIKDVVSGNKWGGEGISLSKAPDNLIPAAAKMSLGISLVRKPYMFHDVVHKHAFTEFFYFFGANPMDMNEFEAEVEFSFGEELETHLIKGPSIVAIPPGVYHCPLNFKKIDKPIYSLEAFMTSSYSGTNLVDVKAAASG